MYNHWAEIGTEKAKIMVPVELPVFKKVGYYSGSFIPTWAVMKNSRHKDEAIKVLMSWCSPRIAEKWIHYTKAPTGIKGNLTPCTLGKDPYNIFTRRITEKYGKNIHYSDNTGFILGKDHKLLQTYFNKKLLQLLSATITAEQAYTEILEKCHEKSSS